MGFCDPSPSQPKLLLVYYLLKGQPHKATIMDTEGAALPGRWAAVGAPRGGAVGGEPLAAVQLAL